MPRTVQPSATGLLVIGDDGQAFGGAGTRGIGNIGVRRSGRRDSLNRPHSWLPRVLQAGRDPVRADLQQPSMRVLVEVRLLSGFSLSHGMPTGRGAAHVVDATQPTQ